jgi:hypothetical protein
MTVSTASIPVLHSVEVVHLYHKSCYPFATELIRPHTDQGNEAEYHYEALTKFHYL